jgi:glycosyltransferase involved in cell wall biosynthesis
MPAKPVILVFIDWFVPGYKAGGPIASCVNFIHLMKNDYSLFIFTSDTDMGETAPYKDIVAGEWISAAGNDFMIYYAKSSRPVLAQIRDAVAFVKPDFVYLNHMFSPKFVIYPLWLKWKGIIKSKVVVCPRGALYESALSVKRYKKTPFLKLFRWMGIHKQVNFHATSEREQKAILDYFPGSRVLVADDLPNTAQPPLTVVSKQPGILNTIFIARIHPIKNLLYLLAAFNQVHAAVKLTIIGPVEDEAYWEKCKTAIAALPSNIKIDFAGSLPNHALLAFLQEHHLFVLPTKGENFGHSIFESFLAGRPVLISDQTPWLHLKEQETGWDLPLNEPAAFSAAIETAAAWDQEVFDGWCRNAWQYAKKFIDNPVLKQQYLQLFS